MQFIVGNRHISGATDYLIGDNADYVANFSFDDEWQGKIKTARFERNGAFIDVLLENDMCIIPVEVLKQGYVKVGVFADAMTTTSIDVFVHGSIKERNGNPITPTEDIYAQIITRIENINTSGMTEEEVRAIVNESLSDMPSDAITQEQCEQIVADYFTDHKEELKGADGADGANGADGKTAYMSAVEGGFVGTEEEFNNQLGDMARDFNRIDEELAIRVKQPYIDNGGNSALTDCADGYIRDFKAFGKAYQTQYQGYNLVPVLTLGATGTGALNYEVRKDGVRVYGINVKAYAGCADTPLTLPSGTYKVIGKGAYAHAQAQIRRAGASSSEFIVQGKDFTIDGTEEFVSFRIQIGSTPRDSVDEVIKAMVCKANVTTDFEPYTNELPSPNPSMPQEFNGITGLNFEVNGTTRQIIPPRTMYKVGNYADILDVEQGVWKYQTELVTPNVASKETNAGLLRYSGALNNLPYDLPSGRTEIISNRFSYTSSDNIVGGAFISGSQGRGMYYFTPPQELTTIEDVNAWFVSENVKALLPTVASTEPINAQDLSWLRNLRTIYPHSTIIVTDQNGNIVDNSFLYPLNLESYVKKVDGQITDNRETVDNIDARLTESELVSAYAYVNGELALALTELGV